MHQVQSNWNGQKMLDDFEVKLRKGILSKQKLPFSVKIFTFSALLNGKWKFVSIPHAPYQVTNLFHPQYLFSLGIASVAHWWNGTWTEASQRAGNVVKGQVCYCIKGGGGERKSYLFVSFSLAIVFLLHFSKCQWLPSELASAATRSSFQQSRCWIHLHTRAAEE